MEALSLLFLLFFLVDFYNGCLDAELLAELAHGRRSRHDVLFPLKIFSPNLIIY